MQKIHILVAVTCLASSTFGQTNYITSPRGFLSTEGNTHFYLTSGTAVNRRYMAIDNTLLGTVYNFKEFALRRDSSHSVLSSAGSSPITISLGMGVGTFARIHQICDDNYVGSKATVFKRQTVSFPDWRTRVNAPAPFDFSLTLNQPHIYLGLRAFIWDLTFEGPASGHRLTDREYTGRANAGSTVLGTGCVAPGQTFGFMHYINLQNNGSTFGNYGMRIVANGAWAPAGGNALMSVALQDANATIPGWCDKLRAVPLVLLNLGNADPLGKIRNQYWSFPWNVNVVGQQFVTQLIAASPNSPNGFVLSNGSQSTMPSAASNSTVQAGYIWANLFNAPSRGALWMGGSYIARLGY